MATGGASMSDSDLMATYHHYIACLNEQSWPELDRFVAEDVIHNGKPIGLSGYRKMLEDNYRDIPDLHFEIELLTATAPYLASRLQFECTPRATFLGLPIHGKKVSFAENVFYEIREGRIRQVWSVIDKAAIEAQLLETRA
jgi:steroid delta-isomerase-like uncharacterized protein